jgi:hypothetical protein
MFLELGLRPLDLERGPLVVDSSEVRVGDRMRFELEGACAVEGDDLVPAQHRRLTGVPREARSSGCHPRRDEDCRAEAVLGEYGSRVLGDVAAAVVEAQSNRALGQLARCEQGPDLADVEDHVALGCEIRHLLAKAPDRNCEVVAVVCDAVVEQDSQTVTARSVTRARTPGRRTRQCEGGLDRVPKGRGAGST